MPDLSALSLIPLQSAPSQGQYFIGAFVLLAAILAAAIVLVRQADGGLADEQLTVRDQIRGALDEPGRTARFDAEGIRSGEWTAENLRGRLGALFDADDVEEPETVRQASHDIREAIGQAWREKTAAIPKQVLALGEWAILVAIFGSLAVFSGGVAAVLSKSPTFPSIGGFLSELGSAGGTLFEWASTLAMAFPLAEFLLSFGLAYGLLFLHGLYARPWVIVMTLVVVGGILWDLERRIGDGVPEPRLGRKRVLAAVLGVGLVVWAIGTGVSTLLSYPFGWAGYPLGAELLGFLAAVGSVVAVLVYSRGWLMAHLRWFVERAPGNNREVAWLATMRMCAHVLRPVGIVAATIYFVAALTTGGVGEVLDAIAGASPVMQVTVLGLILVVFVAIAWEVRAAAPDVYRALVELKAREAIRASTALRGMPYFGVVIVFLAAYAYQAPILLAAVLGILSGFGFLAGVRLYHRARKRYADRDSQSVPQGSILVSARSPQTAAGERYLLTVGGDLYAHEDSGELIETGLEVLQQTAAGEDVDVTIEEWYARHLRRFGLADWTETAGRIDEDGNRVGGKLRERARREMLSELRDADSRRAKRETLLEDACSELPQEIASERLDDMIACGALREHADGTVRLKTDIWANQLDDDRASVEVDQPIA